MAALRQLLGLGDRAAGADKLESVTDQKCVAEPDRGKAIRVPKLLLAPEAPLLRIPPTQHNGVPVIDRSNGHTLSAEAKIRMNSSHSSEHSVAR